MSKQVADRWIFTFGFGHVHPETGERLANHYVVIYGDHDEARKQMEGYFGLKWADQYPDEDAAGVEQFGLKQLILVS